jgi:hypothetical protein
MLEEKTEKLKAQNKNLVKIIKAELFFIIFFIIIISFNGIQHYLLENEYKYVSKYRAFAILQMIKGETFRIVKYKEFDNNRTSLRWAKTTSYINTDTTFEKKFPCNTNILTNNRLFLISVQLDKDTFGLIDTNLNTILKYININFYPNIKSTQSTIIADYKIYYWDGKKLEKQDDIVESKLNNFSDSCFQDSTGITKYHLTLKFNNKIIYKKVDVDDARLQDIIFE